ncbi:MAG TPA: hypothetical protein VH593_20060, partial [Ktedonobacteraceae bacterium]
MKSTIFSVFGILLMMFVPVSTFAQPIEPWMPVATFNTTSIKIHDMAVFHDSNGVEKLAIAEGSGIGAWISFYDGSTLTRQFQAPYKNYQVPAYWRSLVPFKGKLYAGLGDNAPTKPAGSPTTGEVWMYNPSQPTLGWKMVLQTTLTDIYTMAVYNHVLYAGAGQDGSKTAQLWASSDGKNWSLVKQFNGFSYVRSLAAFKGKLYIGLKEGGVLWSYDGTTFTNWGAPPLVTGIGLSQVKSLVPFGDLLYIGCVGEGVIDTFDGQKFAVSADLSNIEVGIYKGTVANNTVFFPTEAKGPGG